MNPDLSLNATALLPESVYEKPLIGNYGKYKTCFQNPSTRFLHRNNLKNADLQTGQIRKLIHDTERDARTDRDTGNRIFRHDHLDTDARRKHAIETVEE